MRWARERGGGALEVGKLRLVDGSERSGALGTDVVVYEAVRERGKIDTVRE